MIYALLMLGTLLFALLLWPTLSPIAVTQADTRRAELEEERELLLDNLAQLQAEQADAALHTAGLHTREKVRLTQVLAALDALPPAPAVPRSRPALPLAAALLVGVAALILLGSLTFLKEWRYVGLPKAQATQLRQASRLPGLEQAATRTQAVADLEAWGNAAWEAQNYGQAAKAYTQILLKNRDNARALRRVGFYLLSDQTMAKDGLSFIQRSVSADPKAPEGQLLYGYALGLFGQYDQALKVLKTYQTLAPGTGEADDLIVEFQQRSGAAVDGQLVYSQNCAACHGQAGQGGKGPKLIGSASLQNAAALRTKVLSGGMAMPAFPQLEGKQLDALVKYLQTF